MQTRVQNPVRAVLRRGATRQARAALVLRLTAGVGYEVNGAGGEMRHENGSNGVSDAVLGDENGVHTGVQMERHLYVQAIGVSVVRDDRHHELHRTPCAASTSDARGRPLAVEFAATTRRSRMPGRARTTRASRPSKSRTRPRSSPGSSNADRPTKLRAGCEARLEGGGLPRAHQREALVVSPLHPEGRTRPRY